MEEVDDCDIILEIESGAGGQEAMLFVEEVFELYQKYAQLKGWQFEITQFSSKYCCFCIKNRLFFFSVMVLILIER